MQTIVTRQGINHLATAESEGETWTEPRCGRNVESGRVESGFGGVECPDCRAAVTAEEVAAELDTDVETIEAFVEWLNEPLDLGFPDGYRPGEF